METIIKHTNFGIAYTYDNIIEINKELLKYPKLYQKVLEHELEHIKKSSFLQTIIIELKDAFDFEKLKMLRQLPLKHRLQSMLPFWFYTKQREFSYNLYLVLLYGMTIGLGLIMMFKMI